MKDEHKVLVATILLALSGLAGVAALTLGIHSANVKSTPIVDRPSSSPSPSPSATPSTVSSAPQIKKLALSLHQDSRIKGQAAIIDDIRRLAPAAGDLTVFYDSMALWYAEREAQGGDPADVAETVDDVKLLLTDLKG